MADKNMFEPARMHCGVSGWSHPHWAAAVFPSPRPRGFHPLEFLASRFDAAEISLSFKQFLKPEVTRLWMKKVEGNPAFQFTAKLHRRFTHDRVLEKADIESFKEGLRPLHQHRKLGCLLMQFPWSFRFTAENREFLIKLRRTFHEFPLVAEMRHNSWMLDEAIGTFIDYHIGFCNIDQPAYTKAMPPTAFLTSSIGYVRLHGRNCFRWYLDGPESARSHRYDYLYSEEELAEWKGRVEKIRPYARRMFVVANNDGEGKAVVNALQLQSMLCPDRETAVPGELFKRFPLQLAQYRTAQKELFTEYDGKRVA